MKSHKINQFFGRYAAFLLRWRWAAIAIFAVILAVSFHGMSKMVQQTSIDDYFIGILTECDNHFTKENLSLMLELGEELLDSLSYGDKITSLVDLEFMLGSDDGMEIVQIVPDEIPETGSPEMEQIRSLAYSKPHVARKLISKDGKNAWILVKLRAFPSEDEWKQTSNISPDIVMLIMTRSLRGIICPLLAVIGGVVITFGVVAFSCFWSILELFQQRKRVDRGWFPKGPGHSKEER